MPTKEFSRRAQETTLACRKTHEAHERSLPAEDLSDERLLSFCRYTDGLPLKDYEQALALVPSLVNLVSLAEAVPIDGSSLPFDLKAIAVKCRSAVYFAPRRFTAIQLAFDSPRSRVLLFHTGRMVGTGCDSPFAAKLAVIRAVKTIANEAGVHIGIRKYAVINEVAAVALNAKIDCDKFADVHSSDSHYDKKSFVGLAWRPAGESICAEVYSTGKANLPGSTRERHMLRSFSRMVPELYSHSSKPEMKAKFPDHLHDMHNPENTSKRRRLAQERALSVAENAANRSAACSLLWEDDTGGLTSSLTYGHAGRQGGSDELVAELGVSGIDDVDINNGDFSAIFGD